MPGMVIFETGEMGRLKRFMELAAGCEIRKVPDRMVFEEGGIQFLVGFIEAVARKHTCENPYQKCDLCEAREMLERRLLAISR